VKLDWIPKLMRRMVGGSTRAIVARMPEKVPMLNSITTGIINPKTDHPVVDQVIRSIGD